jgi:hypothetical protein
MYAEFVPAKRSPKTDPLTRVRSICLALPDAWEKLSHGAPTFFNKKGVFTMFVDNHHADGHVAVWLPAAPGMQALLIEDAPEMFFRPPYVGPSGWVGVELARIGDEQLAEMIGQAWRLIDAKKGRGRGRGKI